MVMPLKPSNSLILEFSNFKSAICDANLCDCFVPRAYLLMCFYCNHTVKYGRHY